MIRSEIRTLVAYDAPNPEGVIKLDAMENPYPLPDNLREEWLKTLTSVEINRYPDAKMAGLRQQIAERDKLKPEQILLGNGSDELIQMIMLAAESGTCIVPQPSFSMYSLIARWLKRPVATFPLNKDFSLDGRSLLSVCAREKASLVFLACPNNPTGNLWPKETIREICENFQGLVVIDEAYYPYSRQSHLDLIAPNVLVMRTFSKIGWAGLRLGYLAGHPETIAHLNKVRLPYNINSLTAATASFLLEHYELFERQAEHLSRARDVLASLLTRFDGVEVFPSETNFLLVRLPDADATFNGLLERGILVKNLHKSSEPTLKNCLRITVGRREENVKLVKAFQEMFA